MALARRLSESKKARILKRAGYAFHSGMEAVYFTEIAKGEWPLRAVSSEQRATLLRELWPEIPRHERPLALAQTISQGDYLRSEQQFLARAIHYVRKHGFRVVAGQMDEQALDQLPEAVTVYRGTVWDEYYSASFGVSWTLDRDRAVWFATKHGRFRNMTSEPVLLRMQIKKDQIDGFLTERSEDEAIIHPKTAYDAYFYETMDALYFMED